MASFNVQYDFFKKATSPTYFERERNGRPAVFPRVPPDVDPVWRSGGQTELKILDLCPVRAELHPDMNSTERSQPEDRSVWTPERKMNVRILALLLTENKET